MADLPTKEQILRWISDNPHATSKRDIAKAFGIKGAARIDLKRILKELEEDGHLQKRRKTYRDPDKLPPVAVLQVLAPDDLGDLFAKPLEWQGDGPEPRILFSGRATDPAVGQGDRILARLQEVQGEDHQYVARLIRKIGTNPRRILGVFRAGSEGGRILPISKGSDKNWQVRPGDSHGAKDGELVEAEQAGPKGRMGAPRARIVTRLGDPGAAKSVSLIAIHEYGIPDAFPDAVIEEADAAKPAGLQNREDLRDIPLVTIDPSDARDHDDACHAHADDDPGNKGGHVIWVAIADVAHYVRPGSAGPRGSAATPPISPTAWCRCCPTGCRATCVRCTRACREPASPCAW
jgi:ribonuclease R